MTEIKKYGIMIRLILKGEEGIEVMEKLNTPYKVVGIKQTKAAIRDGRAMTVYIADDADFDAISDVIELCASVGVESVHAPTLKELGRACGIDVPCAAAAVLKRS